VPEIEKVIIAYEPVWAIGTGLNATPEQANDMHKFIRNIITELYDEKTSSKVRILYGGSMKPSNSKELLSQSDIDGGLIGGASLEADSFVKIIKNI
jgi:triosephosphate isomerase